MVTLSPAEGTPGEPSQLHVDGTLQSPLATAIQAAAESWETLIK